MDNAKFDVILVGTGLTESITAAALAKAGFKVAHIDSNGYYGGGEASLTVDELAAWADSAPSIARSSTLPASSRHYAICLRPSVIPSVGPLISSLVASGVARYGGFRLLERVAVYHPSGVLKHVPGTKEDVFKSKEISLIDKRRLMRFLMFAVSDFEEKKELEGAQDTPFAEFLTNVFSLKGEMHTALVYALALCSSPSDLFGAQMAVDPTLPALHRIRRYLRSAGRYGASPFLVGHYGGTGEIAQGFCRASAVSGGVYILGRKISSISHSESHYSITLDDFPDTLTASVLISSAAHLPPQLAHLATFLPSSSTDPSTTSIDTGTHASVRGIAILDRGILFPLTPSSQDQEQSEENASPAEDTSTPPPAPTPLDAGIIVFPPSSVPGGSTITAATVLVTGEGTMSTPKDRWILYIALPLPDASDAVPAEDLLRPYLDATLALTVPPSPPSPAHTSSELDSTPTPTPTPPAPLFTAFYIEHPTAPLSPSPLSPSSSHKPHIIPAPLAPSAALPDAPDAAAVHAEAAFWGAVRALRELGVRRGAQAEGEEQEDIESFWPPLEVEAEEGGEEEW
ncbi:hypothetical protein DXG03_003988 [Asterophora parasitica]|uniref:FAD/NAD(P)-binding domain-containing protein n=1 Tax=Asterophora parasitica TaxID=117018 RepID=A0A9P7G2T6_9AGAR|nr:hypothetical protein DXG03_003988 [Asterophora parasitica]